MNRRHIELAVSRMIQVVDSMPAYALLRIEYSIFLLNPPVYDIRTINTCKI